MSMNIIEKQESMKIVKDENEKNKFSFKSVIEIGSKLQNKLLSTDIEKKQELLVQANKNLGNKIYSILQSQIDNTTVGWERNRREILKEIGTLKELNERNQLLEKQLELITSHMDNINSFSEFLAPVDSSYCEKYLNSS